MSGDLREKWDALSPRERGSAPPILLGITADDIRLGRRRSCGSCPVARAAMREFPGLAPWVGVPGLVLYGEEALPLRAFALDAAGWDFIRRFDRGMPVAPIVLSLLELPTGAGALP